MLALLLGLALAASHISPADSARLVAGRLLIEPLGVSFAVPPLWLGMPPEPGRPSYHCANTPAGTVTDRIVTERARLPALRDARREWRREYSAVVDSVLPFPELVAHVGGDPWIGGHCSALQMRVYVSDMEVGTLEPRFTAGATTAARFFSPVARVNTDSAGWHMTRLSWNAWYHDYGGTANVEFWVRAVGGRTLIVVFMYEPGLPDQLADRTAIIASLREASGSHAVPVHSVSARGRAQQGNAGDDPALCFRAC